MENNKSKKLTVRRIVLWLEIYKQIDLIARLNSANMKRLCNIAVQNYVMEQIREIRQKNIRMIRSKLISQGFTEEDILMLKQWGLEIEEE